MAIKKNEEKFHSKYLSNTVNDYLNNVITSSKLPAGAIKSIADEGFTDKIVVPTRIPELDRLLKIGGIPRQTIAEFYGPPGGGKTFLAEMITGSITQNYGNAIFFDIEGSFNRERAESLGVVSNRLHIAPFFETGEQILQAICNLLYNPIWEKQGKIFPRFYDLIVLDSVAALGSKNDMEADLIGETHLTKDAGPKIMPASRARMISLFQPRLLSTMQQSNGLWVEMMQGTFLPTNEFYSFTKKDGHLSEELLTDLNEVINQRKSLVKKGNEDNAYKTIYAAAHRRDTLDKLLKELSKNLDLDTVDKLSNSIINKKQKDFKEIRESIISNSGSLEEVMTKAFSKLEKILDDIMDNKHILPTVPDSVKDLEIKANGYVYDDINEKGLNVVHYNPGPILIIINQVRTGNIGSFTGTTTERPGGFAFKHAASNILYIEQINSKAKGQVNADDGESVAGWRSKVTIEKSRYAAPKASCEIVIPFVDIDINLFTQFMSECQKFGLWDISRKNYVLPKDGSIIKTKDEYEWKMLLFEQGLKYLQKEMNYSDEQMAPIYEALEADLATMMEKIEKENSQADFEDDLEE
jgi:RecA/RadA recombinase